MVFIRLQKHGQVYSLFYLFICINTTAENHLYKIHHLLCKERLHFSVAHFHPSNTSSATLIFISLLKRRKAESNSFLLLLLFKVPKKKQVLGPKPKSRRMDIAELETPCSTETSVTLYV